MVQWCVLAVTVAVLTVVQHHVVLAQDDDCEGEEMQLQFNSYLCALTNATSGGVNFTVQLFVY